MLSYHRPITRTPTGITVTSNECICTACCDQTKRNVKVTVSDPFLRLKQTLSGPRQVLLMSCSSLIDQSLREDYQKHLREKVLILWVGCLAIPLKSH